MDDGHGSGVLRTCFNTLGLSVLGVGKRPRLRWPFGGIHGLFQDLKNLCCFRGTGDVEVPGLGIERSELERSTIFHGKIHYFYGHFQ